MPYVAPGPADEGDLLTGWRTCLQCRVRQPMENFHWAGKKKYRRRKCKTCTQARHKETRQERAEYYREWSRNYSLRKKYGLTEQDFEQMLERQNGECAGCHRELTRENTNVDHDRSCCPGDVSCGQCVRGLLCAKCNRALGLLEDSVATLDSLIRYLKKEH